MAVNSQSRLGKRVVKPEELNAQLQRIRELRKKRRYSSSCLNRFLDEIFHLRFIENASYADIALWLRSHKRTKVTKQSVQKFIKRHLLSVEELG